MKLHLTIDVSLSGKQNQQPGLLGSSPVPVNHTPQILVIAKVSFCVSGKFKPNNKATRIKQNIPKLIARASQVRQKPRLLLSHFLSLLAAVLNYSTICQIVVAKPYTERSLPTIMFYFFAPRPFVPQYPKRM